MSELLCPFCGKPLQPTLRIEDEYFCENYDCPQTSITWVGTSSLWKALIDTKKKLDIANKQVDMCMGLAAYAKKHIDGLNSMLESWYKLLQSDKDTATKYAILKSAISAYVENKTALEQRETAFVHNKIKFPEYNDNLLEEFDKQFFENGQDDDLTEKALEQKEEQ